MPIKLTIKPANAAKPHFVEIDAPHVSIGRSSQCDLRLPYPIVSGHHLTLFSEDGQTYQIRDEGSTNGTRLNGHSLTRGKPAVIGNGARLEIVDLQIEIDTDAPAGAGIPVAQTGTLVREMLSETLLETEAGQAHLLVSQGPAAGQRVNLGDKFQSGRIASDAQALLRIPHMPVPVEILRDKHGFAARADAGEDVANSAFQPTLDGQPLTDTQRLNTGAKIRVGQHEICFIDPIESLLGRLDGPQHQGQNGTLEKTIAPPSLRAAKAAKAAGAPKEPAQSGPPDEPAGHAPSGPEATGHAPSGPEAPGVPEITATLQAPAPAPERARRSWHALEIVLVIASLLLVGGVAYVFFLFFDS